MMKLHVHVCMSFKRTFLTKTLLHYFITPPPLNDGMDGFLLYRCNLMALIFQNLRIYMLLQVSVLHSIFKDKVILTENLNLSLGFIAYFYD